MKVGYTNGYLRGLADGRTQALQEFERVLAILREELADARTLAHEHAARADAACDLLLGHLGARAISSVGIQREVDAQERQVKTVKGLLAMPDPTEDLPYDHPDARYKSDAEAAAAMFEDTLGVVNG